MNRLVVSAALLAPSTVLAQQPVAYHKDIAPIVQARCAGCHRPGKAKGGLDLSTLEAFARGGKGGKAFVAGDPGASPVLAMISGPEPEMPAKGKPLTAAQVDLFRRWIADGAKSGAPVAAGPATRPRAQYAAPPPTPAIAWSPKGRYLAVAGYHEILLHTSDASGIAARLVGKSPKVQSLAFSTDGRWLAAVGGRPGQAGEVQVWNVATRQQHRSFDVGTDTLFGVSLSPDSALVAFGGADKMVRVLRVADGTEVLRFKNHAEWVLGTVFTKDGKQLVSGSRDKAMKIIDLENGRFVDDINNPLDPILALARHPKSDVIAYAGGLGTPRIYRISDNQKRTSARRDTNLLKVLEKQSGPVHAVAFGPDGAVLAAGGTDTAVRLHDTKTGKVRARLTGHTGPVFALAFHPGGQQVATAGFDGMLRVYDTKRGALLRTVPAAPIGTRRDGDFLTSLEVAPTRLDLRDGNDQRRLLVTGRMRSGKRVDLTPDSSLSPTSPHLRVDTEGYVVPLKKGASAVRVQAGGMTIHVPVAVQSAAQPKIHFARDVMPVLAAAGCNAGTCHGAKDGKNGFALSLRGFDVHGDYRALVHDLSGRRFDRVQPDQSLMLLKPTGGVPHEGDQVLQKGSRRYEILHRWIVEGTKYANDGHGHVVDLEVIPARLDLAMPGEQQSVIVIAKYGDGTTADVTRDADVSVSDTEVAAIDGPVIRGKRRGEAAVLVAFEGRFATAPITIMGDRSGFAWRPETPHNFVDEIVAAKHQRVKVLPAELCTDAEFVRRLYLDLTGRPPTAEAARKFVEQRGDSRKKRDALIDELVGSPDFVAHWSNKWADLLQCSSRTLGQKGVWLFRDWIAQSVAQNKPYDEFVRELLTASGSTWQNPAANYMRAMSDRGRTPDTSKMTEDVTQTFLGVRFTCCKCHNHPFERWTQDHYYELTAHFAHVRYKSGAEKGELVVFDSYNGGETVHPRLNATVQPKVPFGAPATVENRRERLAAWLTAKDNALFARSYVNRVWSYFFGLGIIEPVDDIRAGNPPSNPELLDALEKSFVASGFDCNELVRTICRSRTWQRSFRTNRWNRDDKLNFTHAIPRRLSAEQLMDAMAIATGVSTRIRGLPEGGRAVDAPDGNVQGDDFLALFGRPKRESACECARTSNLSLAHALNLVGGKKLHGSITAQDGRIAALLQRGADDRAIVTELYWATLSRAPTAKELAAFADLGATGEARRAAAQDLLWALTNSPAFLFNR